MAALGVCAFMAVFLSMLWSNPERPPPTEMALMAFAPRPS